MKQECVLGNKRLYLEKKVLSEVGQDVVAYLVFSFIFFLGAGAMVFFGFQDSHTVLFAGLIGIGALFFGIFIKSLDFGDFYTIKKIYLKEESK